MNPIRHLREELDRLEDALQRAGAALIEVEESNAKELKELLIAYEIRGNRSCNRERWLRQQQGQRLRWLRGWLLVPACRMNWWRMVWRMSHFLLISKPRCHNGLRLIDPLQLPQGVN